jgi:uncharacterized protein
LAKYTISISIVFIIFLAFSCSSERKPVVNIEIKGKEYKFEVASTSEARKTGLMYRKKLDKNGGMLFVYNKPGLLSFYMKNTLIPLDIAFIDDNRVIIEVKQMAPLDETIVSSTKEVQYALEANKGFFERIGAKPGDKLEFLDPVPFID